MNRLFIKISFLILLFFPQINISYAQLNPRNLSSVNVDALSDQQINALIQQSRSAGLNNDQIVAQAVSGGMPAGQAEKLKARLNSSQPAITIPDADNNVRKVNAQSEGSTPALPSAEPGLHIFGMDLFSNDNLKFEPNLNLATPVNYTLGPGDQLNINVYGVSQANWKLDVSPEGNINIPGTGVINVGSKSIAQATAIIKNKLIASNYTIGHGANVEVTLGNIRSIKVIIVGQVRKPGTYTLPSLATAFNALYSAGGPGNNGSFRHIEIIRNNKIIRRLDIYDFLVSGDQKDNINLQDQDIIRVPTYSTHVELSGQVKVPAIFEVLPGETLQDVINFAGGFTDSAYVSRIKVSQIANQHRHITDILEADFSKYHPLRGDKYVAETIVNRYDNRITILGAVFRPGNYELEKGMTLAQLITKTDGLREDAYMDRGTITRLKPDNTTELISFNLKDIINNARVIPLEREDVIHIASLFDLRDQYQVSINGEVRKPGTYAYADSMKVEDLIFNAGGFAQGGSSLRIEVARRISNADPLSPTTSIAKVFTVNSDDKLSTEASNFVLKPFDIISVFSLPGYEKQRMVKVEGEVLYPGIYAIKSKDEKISDLVKRVGGLTSLADVNGATLKRENTSGIDPAKTTQQEISENQQEKANRLFHASQDSSQAAQSLRNNYVGINLKEILDQPGSLLDLYLENDDILRIPKIEQIVKVNGEVLFPSAVVFVPGNSLKDYIDNAGGFSALAWPKRTYIVYPNGTVRSTHKFLFFKSYPSVRPGSEIYVPRKPIRVNNTLQSVFGVTTGLATVGAIILGIISLKR